MNPPGKGFGAATVPPPGVPGVQWVGLLVVALSAWATFVPGASEMLVLDRERVESGELWRWITHPLVHFSRRHWLVDALVFCGLTCAATFLGASDPARRRRGRPAGAVQLLAGLALLSGLTGALSMRLDPGLERLGGLSGINAGVAVGVGWWVWSGGQRALGATVLGAVLLKLALEWAGRGGWVTFDDPSIHPHGTSHWLAAGLAGFGVIAGHVTVAWRGRGRAGRSDIGIEKWESIP